LLNSFKPKFLRPYGGGGPNAVHGSAVGIGADAILYPDAPVITLFRLAHLGIALAAFVLFVELDASMVVASTIVPALSMSPLRARNLGNRRTRAQGGMRRSGDGR
jgi:hypothetical protein